MLNPAALAFWTSLLNIALYSVVSLTVLGGWGNFEVIGDDGSHTAFCAVSALLAINIAAGLAATLITFAFRPMQRSILARYLIIAVAAVIIAPPRMLALQGVPATPATQGYYVATLITGFVFAFVGIGSAILFASLMMAAQEQQAARLLSAQNSAQVIEELQVEELRVRRWIADRLHGNLQFQLVTVVAALDRIADRIDSPDNDNSSSSEELRSLAERLEEIREVEIRSLSHSVMPPGIETGATNAVKFMLQKLPSDIETSLIYGPGARGILADLDSTLREAGLSRYTAGEGEWSRGERQVLPLADRLVATYAVEEGITNALRHGRATKVRVWCDILPPTEADALPTARILEMIVDDNGSGLPSVTPPAGAGQDAAGQEAAAGSTAGKDGPSLVFSGLSRHRDRIRSRGGDFSVIPGPLGGARLRFTLPFDIQGHPDIHITQATGTGVPPSEALVGQDVLS
ncbi:MAG: hypothetical protein FWG11_03665 [Promicromonosporaceae bacterium]|nr:hypothetical protein [Promicromonosporaceae bacterium]